MLCYGAKIIYTYSNTDTHILANDVSQWHRDTRRLQLKSYSALPSILHLLWVVGAVV